jgi:hypothetical protein
MWCCKIVPYWENWDRMKLAADGGNPKTVTHVFSSGYCELKARC